MNDDQLDAFAMPPVSAFPKARDFQDRAHRELRAGVQAGHRRQVLMAPTGAGKTYLALRLANEALLRGKRVLFICDRKTLINQTSATAERYGMPPHGIMQADHPRMAPFRPFQIASAQTLAVRGVNDEFTVIIVDECHTLHSATTELVKSTAAAVVGLSATPFTKGLGQIYSRVVVAETMAKLVDAGILKRLRVRSCVKPDMTGAKTTAGEWQAGEAATRGLVIQGDIVSEWLEHGENRKTIAFGPRVDYCEQLVERFKSVGIKAATFTGTTSDDERAELLEEYRDPNTKLRVLVSVEALAKGFDVPDVSCVIDARPFRKSLSSWVQMIGRGLRQSPGQTDCLLLDHSGNAHRFRNDFQEIYFDGLAELDAGEKLDATIREDDDEGEPPKCPACGYSPCGRRCIQCGFSKPSDVIEAEGESGEMDLLGLTAKAYAPSRRELYEAIVTHERGKAERRGKGNPKGASAHRYREITGAWPARNWSYEEAAAAGTMPSRALQGKLRSLEIAFAKSAKRRLS